MKTTKSAFTMLELVFVIVVIGIISAVAIPRIGNTKLAEGTDQIISHIRYTQHLAMQDDKFDPATANWFRNRWYIRFERDGTTNAWVYSIGSANQPNTYATNPLNTEKRLSGLSAVAEASRTKELQIEGSYGLSITNTQNCPTATATLVVIHFDHLGRPMGNMAAATAPYNANLFQGNCQITFSNGTEDANITITHETGYAYRTLL